MNRQSSGQPIQASPAPSPLGWAGRACASPDRTSGRQTMARARATDLDLLRLSYICRADALLHGQPERSLVLARIHRFFDHIPQGAALDELLLSALIDRGGDAAPPACGPAFAGHS